MSKMLSIALTVAASCLLLSVNAQAKPPAVYEAPQPPVQASSEQINTADSDVVSYKEVGDINSLLCKDILGMVDEDKTIALSFMHGFVMGKRGATQYVSGSLSRASNNFIEHCLDHPKDKALETFANIAK